MNKCSICRKRITPSQKVIRIVVEAGYRDRDDDRENPEIWSIVEAWDTTAMFHLGCVQDAFDTDRYRDLRYGEELAQLPLDDLSNDPVIAGIPRRAGRKKTKGQHHYRAGKGTLRVIDGGAKRK